MILITPLPGVTTTKPGSATKPFPGVDAAVLNERGERVEQGGGYLVLERPWPAMTRGIFGDDAALPRRPTGHGSRVTTSPATAPGSTRTATSGCSAASTT